MALVQYFGFRFSNFPLRDTHLLVRMLLFLIRGREKKVPYRQSLGFGIGRNFYRRIRSMLMKSEACCRKRERSPASLASAETDCIDEQRSCSCRAKHGAVREM